MPKETLETKISNHVMNLFHETLHPYNNLISSNEDVSKGY
jgi:hypothetical protein